MRSDNNLQDPRILGAIKVLAPSISEIILGAVIFVPFWMADKTDWTRAMQVTALIGVIALRWKQLRNISTQR